MNCSAPHNTQKPPQATPTDLAVCPTTCAWTGQIAQVDSQGLAASARKELRTARHGVTCWAGKHGGRRSGSLHGCSTWRWRGGRYSLFFICVGKLGPDERPFRANVLALDQATAFTFEQNAQLWAGKFAPREDLVEVIGGDGTTLCNLPAKRWIDVHGRILAHG